MPDGTRLAIAILMLFGAMVAFFVCFHPAGVSGANSGPGMLQWFMQEFENTVSGDLPATADSSSNVTPSTGQTQPQNPSDLLNTSNVGPTVNQPASSTDLTNLP